MWYGLLVMFLGLVVVLGALIIFVQIEKMAYALGEPNKTEDEGKGGKT